jgi:hypothetical protein
VRDHLVDLGVVVLRTAVVVVVVAVVVGPAVAAPVVVPAGVVVVVAGAAVVLSLRAQDRRRADQGALALDVVTGACILAIAAAIVLGIYVMTQK